MVRLYSYKKNFGDDLSPYIISKLSGEKVVYRKPFSFKRLILDVLRFVKKIILKGVFDKSLIMYSPFNKIIVSIGSIIEESTANCIVWGSGLASKDIYIKGGEFLAVRGPLTQKRLKELGFDSPNVIGDPALLLPLIYKKELHSTKNKIGFIPHKSDYKVVNELILSKKTDDFLVIDLVDPDLEKVINDFLSCDYILSTSLHGLIVAHAYGIPAIWFEESKLLGDGSKFIDYFKSVGIEPYEAFKISNIDLNVLSVKEFFKKNDNISLPKIDLSAIQEGLLSVAPFKIKDEFKQKR